MTADPPGISAEEPLGPRILWGKELAAKVRALRLEFGLQQDDLIRRSGLSRATVQNYERGEIDHPWMDTVAALSVGLGVELDRLLPDDFRGRIALGILARMERDQGKELARLTQIAGQSNRLSRLARSGASSDSNAADVTPLPVNKPEQRRKTSKSKRREGGISTRALRPAEMLAVVLSFTQKRRVVTPLYDRVGKTIPFERQTG